MMKRTLAAAGLAAALLGGPAAAQDSLGAMDMGLSMVELSVSRELTQLGMGDVDVSTLTLSQLAGIRLVLGDRSMTNDQERAEQVQRIVAGEQRTVN